jgi:hypothetical protein
MPKSLRPPDDQDYNSLCEDIGPRENPKSQKMLRGTHDPKPKPQTKTQPIVVVESREPSLDAGPRTPFEF